MTRMIQVTGIQAVIRAIGKARKKDAIKIAEGLEKSGHVILRKSQKYVPVETGALKASGQVITTGRGMGARTTVVYGSQVAFYALYVHEDLTKRHTAPTCAKYLERAVREVRGTIASIVARQIESSMQKTFGFPIPPLGPMIP